MHIDRRLEVVLVSLIMIVGAFYARVEYIPPFAERHVELAEEKYDLDLADPNPWFSAWAIGDGQAFAVIAADPSGMKLSEEIKEPAYRFSRAGFGWLAAFLSLGQERWIPYGMALAGVVSLVGTTVLAVVFRPRVGPRVWLLLFNPAIYLGFAGDTAEPLALLFLAYALATGSRWASAAVGMTRPSFLVAMIGRWRQLAWGGAATALILSYALIRFGLDEFIPGGGRLDLPLRGYLEHPSVFGWAVAVMAAATVVVGIRRRDWGWVISGVFTLCLGTDVLANPVNAWRAAGMLPVLWALGPGYQPAPDTRVVSSERDSVSTDA